MSLISPIFNKSWFDFNWIFCVKLCTMALSGVLLLLYLPLLFIDAKSVGLHEKVPSSSEKPSSNVKLEPLWTVKQVKTEQSLPLPDMLDLDLDRHQRQARGADEDEQQSTFSHSFENEWVTTPQLTEFNDTTLVKVANGDHEDDNGLQANTSVPHDVVEGLFNPFYPLVESSYAAYAVLFLAGLVLAVGVVGNMAVMCIVWNNYFMRSAWNYLLASMAFWDFLVLVLCLPVVVLNQLSHRRILGDITCRMVPYMEVRNVKADSEVLTYAEILLWHQKRQKFFLSGP